MGVNKYTCVVCVGDCLLKCIVYLLIYCTRGVPDGVTVQVHCVKSNVIGRLIPCVCVCV
jgi:hypothetical protein